MDRARQIALIVLKEVNDDGKYANISLKEHLKGAGLDNRDASFVTQLVYGTLENQAVIDEILKEFANMKKVNPWIENILRLGCYQIVYLDRVPDSAACNESVKLCTKFGLKPLRGFVNGVLRNISRKKDSLDIFTTEPGDAESLSAKYGLPLWLTRMWVKEYGIEAARGILKSPRGSDWVTIRMNRSKTNRENLIIRLKEQGVELMEGFYFKNALRVRGIGDIQSNPLFRQGFFTVQGESSMLVCHTLCPKPGETILDACSAPGGKAIYIAELMENTGKIYARDIHEHRLDLINRNRARMGVDIMDVGIQDGTIFNPDMEETMDRVLIDAPCSGWGVLHKKPDIGLRIRKEEVESLYRLQKRIIKNCSQYVKIGGVLVYSTCTINPWENEKVIEGFLKESPEFVLEDFGEHLPQSLKSSVIRDGMIQLIPGLHNVDGFFIAKLRRIGL